MSMGTGGSSFGTLDRTFALLETVAADSRPQSLTNLSRRISAPKTSVHRLLGVLVRNDLLERGDEGYSVGDATRRLSQLVLDRVPAEVVSVLEPFAGDLFERTGDYVVIGVPQGGSVVAAHTIRSHRHAHLAPSASRIPIRRSAVGKLWLAAQPDPVLLAWLTAEHANLPHVLAELRRVRHTGVATLGDEVLCGADEMAMPIVGVGGMVAGIARRYARGQRPTIGAVIAHHEVAVAASAAVRRLQLR
jgi:DNA-binding IclR family transcriptional regulator